MKYALFSVPVGTIYDLPQTIKEGEEGLVSTIGDEGLYGQACQVRTAPGGVTAAGETDTGYEIDGTALTITSSGTYTVSGSCADGSIKVKKSTTGVTLAAGQYLVTFVSDTNVAAAGTLGASLELGGAALPYAVTAETQDAAGADRITLTAIVTPTTAQPLTVINSSGSSNTYTNSTLTICLLYTSPSPRDS